MRDTNHLAGDLELVFEIRGLDRVIYDSPARWGNYVFNVDETLTGRLTVTERGIFTDKDLALALGVVERCVTSLVLALEWRYRRPLVSKEIKRWLPLVESHEGSETISERARMSDRASTSVAPIKPPASMPQVPIECSRWIRTLTEASNFTDCVEEQLRRHYLIIEELWPSLRDEFSPEQQAIQPQIKFIRDFVSHATCNQPKLVAFISALLPSAATNCAGAAGVRFLRNEEHRNFVARYEATSRNIASRLIDLKIKGLPV